MNTTLLYIIGCIFGLPFGIIIGKTLVDVHFAVRHFNPNDPDSPIGFIYKQYGITWVYWNYKGTLFEAKMH